MAYPSRSVVNGQHAAGLWKTASPAALNPALELDAGPRQHTLAIVVLHLAHLCNQIGTLDDLTRRSPPGEHQLSSRRALVSVARRPRPSAGRTRWRCRSRRAPRGRSRPLGERMAGPFKTVTGAPDVPVAHFVHADAAGRAELLHVHQRALRQGGELSVRLALHELGDEDAFAVARSPQGQHEGGRGLPFAIARVDVDVAGRRRRDIDRAGVASVRARAGGSHSGYGRRCRATIVWDVVRSGADGIVPMW